MSDFRKEIATIVKKSGAIKQKYNAKAYYFSEIPEKIMKGLKKQISSEIGIGNVAAVYDYSAFDNGTSGIVFTTNGIYHKDFLLKKIYFNYADVTQINYVNPYIEVKVGNTKYYLSNTCIDENKFCKLVNELKTYVLEQGIESKRISGAIKKKKMPKDLYNKCNVIIHGASATCGGIGAGLAQLPCADTVPITGAQIAMIIALGQVFELNITDSMARGILTGMAGSFVGRGVVQIAFGWIPLAGNAINTATAAGLTEAIGWTVANQFYQQSLDNAVQYSYDGEVKGFKDASEIYEKKLRDQAKHFLIQKKVLEEELDELNRIIDEYEIYIKEHELDKSVTVSIMKDEIIELKSLCNV